MFAAGKTAGVSGNTVDAQFNYVTMLLHGDGTNGAQNNTFLDSSTNNFTITRNGNTTQGSFSPYGSNWSNYFNGTNATLNFPNSSNFAFGTGSFTIEFWINAPLDGDKFFLGGRSAIGSMHITSGGGGTSTTTGVLRYVATSTIVSSNVVTDSTWHHCAIVRNGSSNITLYVDGISVGTGTDTNNYTTTSGTWYIARNDLGEANFLNGYLSNLRIVKGTAVYTSNFTPSTTPLTAISGTSLLTCADNRFIDDSATAVTVTPTGSTSVQRFNPFGTATAYSTSVIGGSGYFDGSGDYLNAGSNSAFAVGTGDFTFQTWIYPTSFQSPVSAIFETGSSVSANRFSVVVYSNGQVKIDNNTNLLTSTVALVLNQWTFISVIRSSGTMTMYFNGTSVASGSISTNFSETQGVIGKTVDNYYYPGYITDLRLVKGTALSNTVPTAPLTNVTNTSLLTNMINGAIFDNAMMNNLETAGNAQISTSVVKYGTGSMSFNGTNSYLTSPYGPIQNFGTGNFTIEGWVYLNSLSASYYVVAGTWTTGTTDEWLIQISNANTIRFLTTAGTSFYSATITTSTWYHIAAVRNGSTITLYVNGTSVGSYTNSNSIGSVSKTLYIGVQQSPIWYWNGYIDEFRITNGYARYTANFTPPTAAFPNTGPY